jgi:peptidyl-prolyl cis-trans isomerase SDCCAG10
MANQNKPHSNDSQFFITLDKCTWLEKKHTIFGKVVGDTYYNVLTISELPTDGDDRPDEENPPKILRCDIVINPFPDIFPRRKIIEGKDNKVIRKPKNDVKLKNYENKNLISFEEDEANETIAVKGIKASHEFLKNDRKLVNKPVIDKEHFESLKTHQLEKEDNLKELKEKVKSIKDNTPFQMNPKLSKQAESEEDSSSSESRSFSPARNDQNKQLKQTSNLIEENEELFSENKKEINNLRKEILKIKRRKDDPDEESRLKEEIKLYTPLQKYREKYLNKKKSKMGGRETIEMLLQFKEKMKSNEGNEDNWMSNKLKFHVDSQKAYSINENISKQNTNADIDAIEIIDPRKRMSKMTDTQSKPELLNLDKMFNVEDLVNKVTKQ